MRIPNNRSNKKLENAEATEKNNDLLDDLQDNEVLPGTISQIDYYFVCSNFEDTHKSTWHRVRIQNIIFE